MGALTANLPLAVFAPTSRGFATWRALAFCWVCFKRKESQKLDGWADTCWCTSTGWDPTCLFLPINREKTKPATVSVSSLNDPRPSHLRTRLAPVPDSPPYPHLLSHTCSFHLRDSGNSDPSGSFRWQDSVSQATQAGPRQSRGVD